MCASDADLPVQREKANRKRSALIAKQPSNLRERYVPLLDVLEREAMSQTIDDTVEACVLLSQPLGERSLAQAQRFCRCRFPRCRHASVKAPPGVARAGPRSPAYSGHGLRAGSATGATRAGVSTFKIRRPTGYASDAVHSHYVREENSFSGTPPAFSSNRSNDPSACSQLSGDLR